MTPSSKAQDAASTTNDAAAAQGSVKRRRWFAGLAALGGAGLLGGAAQAQGFGGGWGGHGHHGGGGMDPEEMARRLDYRLSRMVKFVGGTPEQKDRLSAIVKAAMADLKPLREQHRAARAAGIDLLAAPVIDRRALEALRVSQMQLADTLSRRVTTAMADAADVFNPEQRGKLAAMMKQRMGRHRPG